MTKEQEYQRYAREALDLAHHSKSDSDKATWLKIAEKWLDLLDSRTNERQQVRRRDTRPSPAGHPAARA